jgi:lysyl-tRNA synthetase class 2
MNHQVAFCVIVTRDQFLKSHWRPYPPAPEGCASLARWSQNEGTWVAGTLVLAPNPNLNLFYLSSAQNEMLGFQWSLGSSASMVEVLQAGDHIAVKVSKRQDGIWCCEDWLLLAPGESAPPLENQRRIAQWPRFLEFVRSHWIKQGLIEIETPDFVVCPGLEPNLEPFAIDIKLGSFQKRLYLPTSPEIHLKKALCYGFTDIFEMKKCYRNGEMSDHHQPEFHMLEWYRAYSGLDSIITDVQGLLRSLNLAGWIEDEYPQKIDSDILLREVYGKS